MLGGAVLWTLAALASLLGPAAAQFTRDSLYHAMNDRGVYLPDDYNSDLPPAQVRSAAFVISISISAVKRSIGSTTGCTITEKAPTSAFTFKTLLRHYAKQALTPRSLNVKLSLRRKGHKAVSKTLLLFHRYYLKVVKK